MKQQWVQAVKAAAPLIMKKPWVKAAIAAAALIVILMVLVPFFVNADTFPPQDSG